MVFLQLRFWLATSWIMFVAVMAVAGEDNMTSASSNVIARGDTFLVHLVTTGESVLGDVEPALFGGGLPNQTIVTHTATETGKSSVLFFGRDSWALVPKGIDRINYSRQRAFDVAVTPEYIFLLTFHATASEMRLGAELPASRYRMGSCSLAVFAAETGTFIASVELTGKKTPTFPPQPKFQGEHIRVDGDRVTALDVQLHFDGKTLTPQ